MILLVVAGGSSRRFGRDKRLFALAGAPLLSRTVENLRPLGLPVYVAVASSPGRLPRPEGAAFWLDAQPGAGPLPVVLAALERRGDDVLCVAADLVGLRVPLLQRLVAASRRTTADVVAYGVGPDLEPLCAVYSVRCRPWLAAAAEKGESSLQRALRAHPERVERLPLPAERAWTNLNAPRDRGNIGRRGV